jgi:ribosome-binding protein aMBF1 (putative translation factor)
MDSAMTPDRIRECLAAMHWSQRRLAEILYCDDRMVRRWADGSEPIPESVERWLEELVSAHKALPLPIAPKR